MSTLPQNEVYMSILPQIGMSQTEVNITVLPENEVFQIVAVNFQLSSRVKTIINFVIHSGVQRFKILPSTLVRCGEKLCWTIRILLESFRYVLEMYTWSLSENQSSVVILRNCFLSIDRIFPVILPILFDFIGRHSES